METIIVIIIIITLLVFGLRVIGAWMLRINIVIRELKYIHAELQELNKKLNN